MDLPSLAIMEKFSAPITISIIKNMGTRRKNYLMKKENVLKNIKLTGKETTEQSWVFTYGNL